MADILVIYHDDPDGMVAGAIVKQKHPEAETFPIDYGQEFPWDKVVGKEVWLVDYSLPPLEMQRLIRSAEDLVWIDHHVSAINAMARFPNQIRGLRRVEVEEGEIKGLGAGKVSGCELTWAYVYPGQRLPEIVRLIGRFDVGEWADPRVLPCKLGFEAYGEALRPDNLTTWKSMLFRSGFVPWDIDELIEAGRPIKRWLDVVADRMVKRGFFPLEWEGLKWMAVNSSMRGSTLFSGIDPAGFDAFMVFFFDGGLQAWNFSLSQAKPGVNVAKIAEKHGGGGHARAAGFEAEDLPFDLPKRKLSFQEVFSLALKGVS